MDCMIIHNCYKLLTTARRAKVGRCLLSLIATAGVVVSYANGDNRAQLELFLRTWAEGSIITEPVSPCTAFQISQIFERFEDSAASLLVIRSMPVSTSEDVAWKTIAVALSSAANDDQTDDGKLFSHVDRNSPLFGLMKTVKEAAPITTGDYSEATLRDFRRSVLAVADSYKESEASWIADREKELGLYCMGLEFTSPEFALGRCMASKSDQEFAETSKAISGYGAILFQLGRALSAAERGDKAAFERMFAEVMSLPTRDNQQDVLAVLVEGMNVNAVETVAIQHCTNIRLASLELLRDELRPVVKALPQEQTVRLEARLAMAFARCGALDQATHSVEIGKSMFPPHGRLNAFVHKRSYLELCRAACMLDDSAYARTLLITAKQNNVKCTEEEIGVLIQEFSRAAARRGQDWESVQRLNLTDVCGNATVYATLGYLQGMTYDRSSNKRK